MLQNKIDKCQPKMHPSCGDGSSRSTQIDELQQADDENQEKEETGCVDDKYDEDLLQDDDVDK